MTAEQLRKIPWVPPMFRPLERNMLDLDSPDHTRLRTLVHKAFTPSLVARMRARIQSLADELLTQVMHKGECDLIRDYALPLPMTIITEILGVPTSDRHKFHKWSKAVVSLSSPTPTLRFSVGIHHSPVNRRDSRSPTTGSYRVLTCFRLPYWKLCKFWCSSSDR
jgi:cytochrome P450